MTTIKKTALGYAAVLTVFSFSWVLIGQPAHARVIRQRGGELTPEQQATIARQGLLDRAASASLHAGRYTQAEAEARQALSLGLDSGVADNVLGAALEAQGKDQEALQIYKTQIINGKDGPDGQTRALLPYAFLLLKSGQWEQAVAAYNSAISQFSEKDLVRVNSHFSPDQSESTALAVAIHIALGVTYNSQEDWAGEPQNTEAIAEYGKALHLAPDSDLANYYYGVGWQKLSPAEQAKFGSAAQAKAALTKAVKIGKGPVKKAAQKALRMAMQAK